MSRTLFLSLIFCLAFFLLNADSPQLLRQNQTDTSLINQNKVIDPFGRLTPRGTANGFLKCLANSDYLRASKYINFPETVVKTDDSLISNMVQRFELLLNKNGRVSPLRVINNTIEGDLNDGLIATYESIGSLNLNSENIPIILELGTSNNAENLWLFSIETTTQMMNHIDENATFFDHKTSSNSVLATKWKGGPIVDWILMIALALGSYLVAWLITIVIARLVRQFWKNFNESEYSKLLGTLLIPLRLVLAVALLLMVSRSLGISILVRQAFSVVNLIAMWTAFFIFIWLLINTISTVGEERFRERQIFGALSAISFLRNSAKFALVVIAILMIFDTLGFNVTAGLAALGVGGIALALGAQKTVENIVGGLSVIFDQPVSVGDFCKFGETVGTVEKIGMRSTRIRTLGRTIVTIPNADFSSQLIENYAKRDMFLFLTTLGLRYETSSDQMRYILVELRKILYAHPKVNPEPARVRFLGYGSDSLKVEIFAYIHAVDWNDFLGIQEDINLRIAKVIEDSGSGFAFPSQTVYLSKDQGLSESKKAEAEAKVKEWMENNELHIPNFDSATIESLKHSLDYPYKYQKEAEG